MSVLRIRTTREEFEAAEEGGCVYGEIPRQITIPVYVELGMEADYIPSPKDNPRTEYRLFAGCNVYIAEKEEELDRGEYIARQLNTAVIVYC